MRSPTLQRLNRVRQRLLSARRGDRLARLVLRFERGERARRGLDLGYQRRALHRLRESGLAGA